MSKPQSPLANTTPKSLSVGNPLDKPSTPQSSQLAQPDNTQNLSALLRNATDKALTFLSTASNEQLGACLVGLGATTYFVFGRVGLVLIGVVGGVVLHASWDGSRDSGSNGEARLKELNRRREVGIDVAQRILDWRETRKNDDASDEDIKDALGLGLNSRSNTISFSDFRSETSLALNEFADAVIRDYVNYWYSPVIPEEVVFPQSCRKVLISFIVSLSNNLSRKRPADTFVEFTTNSSSIVIVFLNELSAALSSSPNTTAPEAIQTYLLMKPECNLASITDKTHQGRKLQSVADDILESYLDPTVYRCAPPRIFLQKILTHVVLEMTIDKCSRAEWINEWIIYLLEEGEPELLNAIDAGVDSAAQAETSDDKDPLFLDRSEKPRSSGHGRGHSRTVSKAEEAMDEAMREAKRLTQMIQEEEEKRQREQGHEEQPTPIITSNDMSDASDSTTHGIQTPSSSSQSDLNGDQYQQPLQEPQMTPPPSGSNQLPEPKRSNHGHSSSILDGEKPLEAASLHEKMAFTTFDQLAPDRVPTALTDVADASSERPTESLTLHRANIILYDDSQPSDKRAIKSKPMNDYLIQIEPAAASYPGWMIPRTYADFETLHEVLRRISKVTGINFATTHEAIPAWRGKTKSQLKDDLERYLGDAMHFEQLAECEGMKRFLEKSRGLTQDSSKGFWPNPANIGKGMIDTLAKAPNQVAGGGKAFFGGVAGVFTGGANNTTKRQSQYGHPRSYNMDRVDSSKSSFSTKSFAEQSTKSIPSGKAVPERLSVDQDALRKSPPTISTTGSRPSLEPRRSSSMKNHTSKSTSVSPRPSITLERRSSQMTTASDFSSPDTPSGMQLPQLPPPPEDMPDEYDYTHAARNTVTSPKPAPEHISQTSVDGTNFVDVPTPPTPRSPRPQSPAIRSPSSISHSRVRSPNPSIASARPISDEKTKPVDKRTIPLSEPEAQVTIELLFAVITELFTLSSAWGLRRTLLGAAKTFLLRPGNPQLESIRLLLQETLLDANTSDMGIASHVRKLRENTLPTETELAAWPKERTAEEKEALRVKARELLVKRGMPQALTSVMGQAASGEALGKVFDCLQVEAVGRGLVFGLVLQAVRGLVQ